MYYVYSDKLPGKLNMALDVCTGESQLFLLRIYTWERPTLSLGRYQKTDGINWDFIEKSGFDVVRRPTGGRAVLHWDEITYSIVVPKTQGIFELGVLEFYNFISKLLTRALNYVGYPVEFTQRHNKGNSAICFDTPAQYEITLNSVKVVGSAQMRTKDFILQHGSIVLVPHEEIKNCFHGRHDEIKLIGLYDFKIIPFEKIVESIKQAFLEHFGILEDLPQNDWKNFMKKAKETEDSYAIYRGNSNR